MLPSRAGRRRRFSALNHAVLCEPLEPRVLLTGSYVHTSYWTNVYLDKPPSVQPSPIKLNAFRDPEAVVNKTVTLTDKNGTHIYNATASAFTTGTNPSVYDENNSGTFMAMATAETTISNSNGHTMYNAANSNLEYYINLEYNAPLKPALLSIIQNNGYLVIPIHMTFRGTAEITGTPGLLPVSATARAQLFGDNDETLYDNTVTADKNTTSANFDDTIDTQIRFIPFFNLDYGHMYIYLQATVSAPMIQAGGASADVKAVAYADPQFSFNQAAFDTQCASLGIATFNIKDYFSLSVKDPANFHTPMTISAPDLTDASDTGVSPTDNITGDRTPTFTGTVTDPLGSMYSTSSLLPPGITLPPGVTMPAISMPKMAAPTTAVLYVDGVPAGRAKLTNPQFNASTGEATFTYTLTASPLAAGRHAVMVAAGSDTSLAMPSEPLLITIDGGIPLGPTTTLSIGTGAAKSLTYTDDDGTTATITLNSGHADLTFEGDNLQRVDTTAGIKLTGSNISLNSLSVTNSTAGTLSFALKNAKGSDGKLNIGSITTAGAIKAISAGNVNLWGDITLGGPIATLVVGSIFGPATLAIAGSATSPAASLTFARIRDLTITSQIPLKSIKAIDWLDTDAVPDALTAPSLGALTTTGAKAAVGVAVIPGNFNGCLALSGANVATGKPTLASVKIAGNLQSCTWDIIGNMGALSVTGTVGGRTADFAAVINTTGNMGGAGIRRGHACRLPCRHSPRHQRGPADYPPRRFATGLHGECHHQIHHRFRLEGRQGRHSRQLLRRFELLRRHHRRRERRQRRL